MEALHNKLELSVPNSPKPSAELLRLKNTKEQLSKQKNYMEAMKVKEEEQKLAEEEDKQWKQERAKKIAVQEAQLMQRHTKEREAHNKRADLALLELEKEKDKRIQYIEKYYKKPNVKSPKANITSSNEPKEIS
eukprot:TRINITY_DN7111_c0_g1_i3.p3 TRINITY_DN7111_c0_g1~~TRINITY_DN7111_c0_g1_i3.p3  ORF type:complete len:134 (-),score=49.62 TRINITY_DN7111_c0_g1_i3:143-544(-)